MAKMVLRVTSCPLTIAREGEHLFLSGSDKKKKKILVANWLEGPRSPLSSWPGGENGSVSCEQLRKWAKGGDSCREAGQTGNPTAFGRRSKLPILRAYQTGCAGFFSQAPLFSRVRFPRTRQQPVTLAAVIPVRHNDIVDAFCSVLRWCQDF